jgi:hypothetical protein
VREKARPESREKQEAQPEIIPQKTRDGAELAMPHTAARRSGLNDSAGPERLTCSDGAEVAGFVNLAAWLNLGPVNLRL